MVVQDQPFCIIREQSCSMFGNDCSGSAVEMLWRHARSWWSQVSACYRCEQWESSFILLPPYNMVPICLVNWPPKRTEHYLAEISGTWYHFGRNWSRIRKNDRMSGQPGPNIRPTRTGYPLHP